MKQDSGFIAIISVVIIAALLLAISASLSFSGFFTRSNIADGEYKEHSTALAEACIQEALVKLAANPNYTGNETITIGSDSCTIGSITTSGVQKTIRTSGSFRSTTTNLQVTANALSLSTTGWQEIP